MDIIQETQKAISQKIAYLQKQETEWMEKQGGKLEQWQEQRLRYGVTDVQRLQNLLIYIDTLSSERAAAPLTRREEILIKYGYTEKDILLKRLVMLIDDVLDGGTDRNPLSIKIEKKAFLYLLRGISTDYKTLTHGKK